MTILASESVDIRHSNPQNLKLAAKSGDTSTPLIFSDLHDMCCNI